MKLQLLLPTGLVWTPAATHPPAGAAGGDERANIGSEIPVSGLPVRREWGRELPEPPSGPIGRRAGRAEVVGAPGRDYAVFEVVRATVCRRCGQRILPGMLYTRYKTDGAACTDCVPLLRYSEGRVADRIQALGLTEQRALELVLELDEIGREDGSGPEEMVDVLRRFYSYCDRIGRSPGSVLQEMDDEELPEADDAEGES